VSPPDSRDAAPTIDTSAPRDRDAALQACRRIDWRFLLENPQLGRLGYGGREDPLLIDACRRVAASFASIDDRRADLRASLDTVVLVDPDTELLSEASSALRPGGSLYAELGGRQRNVSRCVAKLHELGLTDVTTHWHIPDFATAVEIVPLDQPGAIRHVLMRHGGSGSRRLAFLGVRFAPIRIVRRAARHVSVTARSPAADTTA
jgi:hypothetical protein